MKKLTAICFLLLASLSARADLVIVQNLSMGAQNQVMTMKLKGDKARVDVANGQFSSIIDLSSGDMLNLMHEQKSYMKISGEKTKAMVEQMKAAQGKADDTADASKITDTGKTEKVGDYNCKIYTATFKGMQFSFWVTKDIPNYAAVQEQMKKLQSLQDKLGQRSPDISKVDGVAVKVETINNGQTITMLMGSIKQEPVPDADLQAPADYTEVKMPQMPAAPAGGAPAAPAPQP